MSKAWNILALDGSNWQYVDLFDFQVDIEGIVVENIARRCGGFLRKLSLRGCQAVGDNALATFSQYCNNIEHLDLKFCKMISDRTSESLSLHCHKLQYLDVSSCSCVTDISLHALGIMKSLIISILHSEIMFPKVLFGCEKRRPTT